MPVHAYTQGVSKDVCKVLHKVSWIQHDMTCKLWLHAQILLEGQEEVGSPDFAAFLRSHKSLLKADYALSADGGQMFQDQGILAIGLRGAVAVEVTLQTLSSDQHSGIQAATIYLIFLQHLGPIYVAPVYVAANKISLHHITWSMAETRLDSLDP